MCLLVVVVVVVVIYRMLLLACCSVLHNRHVRAFNSRSSATGGYCILILFGGYLSYPSVAAVILFLSSL